MLCLKEHLTYPIFGCDRGLEYVASERTPHMSQIFGSDRGLRCVALKKKERTIVLLLQLLESNFFGYERFGSCPGGFCQ